MRPSSIRRSGIYLALLSGFPSGCASFSELGTERDLLPPTAAIAKPAAELSTGMAPKALPSITLTAGAGDTGPQPTQLPPPAPLTGLPELSVEVLVEQVIARNPSLAQITAAWEAASSRYPQATSFDDPVFGTTLAPGAFGSRPNGYRFEVSQRIPFPGKLPLKGEVAKAEANAAGRDVEAMRQQLTEVARDAFYEYYLVARATEVNEEILKLLRSSKETAEGLYKTGRVKQQDVLLLDVEIGRQRGRSLILDRQRQVTIARINALLHQTPDTPLPPPPKLIAVDEKLPDPKGLREQALTQRLDLLALSDRIAAAQASYQLARREYYPDFDVMGAYDSFWDNAGQRVQAGVRFNLPVQLGRRDAAVVEAQARLNELKAQFARQQDQTGFEVQQAYEQCRESLRTARLFETEVLPAARLSVKSAQTGYQTGETTLLVLLEAQRNLADLQDQYYQATSEFFRRKAALQRTLTGPPAASPLPTPAAGQPSSAANMGR